MTVHGGDDGSDGCGRIPLAPTLRPDQALQIEQLVADRNRSALEGSLLVIAGAPADIGTHWVVDGTAIIGRDPTAFQLRDAQTSRQHVSVCCRDGRHMVSDLGSTNGTLLNGVRLSGEHPLADGDKIYLGQTVIKFMLVDVTEAAYLHRMERLAGIDELTGLLAKHRFDSLLAEALRSAQATSAPLSLLMMDMDGLKQINDRHGHQMGAHSIAQVGQLLARQLRHRGEACRFGGDEFCAMLPGSPLAPALHIAEEIRAAVAAATFRHGSAEVRTSISIGVAQAASGVTSPAELLSRADEALYRAKARGRNAVCD